MELTGLLLGAGASYDVGMPLVDELDRDLKRYMSPERLRDANRRSRDHHTGVSDETIEDLVKLLHQSCMNYEHIIGNLEVRSHRTHTDQGFHHLRESMSEWVYMFLLEWHVNNKEFMQRNLGLLDGITELVRRNSPLWVFSLNQDLIMEAFSTHSGIPMRCGFTDEIERLPLRDSTGSVVGDLEAQVLPSELIRNMALHFFKIGEEGINLLKIHGSLDVFATRDGHDFLKLMAVDGTVRGGIDALQLANKDLRPDWSGPTVRVTNEIVYADQDGEIQFLRRTPLTGAFKFQDAHSQVIPPKLFSIFESNLNHLSTLVPFPDRFVDTVKLPLTLDSRLRGWE